MRWSVNPALREVVGANFRAAVAGADLAGAGGVALGLLLGLQFVVEPGTQDLQCLVLVL